jgi:uncharacterized protein (TIGR02996 family)
MRSHINDLIFDFENICIVCCFFQEAEYNLIMNTYSDSCIGKINMAKCFVIMPYGGQDETKRKHYLGVYNQIIRAAAIEAGFQANDIKRSDIASVPGSILADIIQDLYTADIVIADLSESNPNVYWELGVRHVLAKSGTVTIIDENHKIPFDLGQYRTITYSTSNLGSISEVVIQIADAIKKRINEKSRSDNAVHDILPELPIRFASIEADSEVLELKSRINSLAKENETLTNRLNDIDPAGTLRVEQLDIAAMIEQANLIHQQTGENMLLRLASAKEMGEEQFISELTKAVQNPYLSVSDFLQMRKMCKEMGLEHHQRTVLEIATSRYPRHDSIRIELIDSYDDANSFHLQERGRLMIEEYLGVIYENGLPRATNRVRATKKAIELIFLFYSRTNQYESIISVSSSLEELVGPLALISRNKARALGRIGAQENAITEFERAITLDPKDDTTYMVYADYVDDLGKYEDAYILFEKAFINDQYDGTRLLALAGHIILRGYVRDDDGVIISDISREDKIKYAMPLIVHAIRVSPHPNMVQRVIKYLVSIDQVEYATIIASGEVPEGEYEFSALNWIINALAKP